MPKRADVRKALRSMEAGRRRALQEAQEIADSFSIRRESLMHGIPYYTTVQAARMAVGGLEAYLRVELPVRTLQEYLRRA